jgi:polyisoprenoid-binding protein YceI
MRFLRLPGVIAFVMMVVSAVFPQEWELADESRLWIDGTSSVNSFTCRATDMDGTGVLKGRDSVEGTESPALITVQVPALDCGNRRMNSDLRDAMKADEFPTITFRLEYAERVRRSDAHSTRDGANADSMRVQVVGTLTLAGQSREVVVLMTAERLEDGRYRGTGKKDLKMTDFGITPPTALLGLVKARDEITIGFDLIAERNGHP